MCAIDFGIANFNDYIFFLQSSLLRWTTRHYSRVATTPYSIGAIFNAQIVLFSNIWGDSNISYTNIWFDDLTLGKQCFYHTLNVIYRYSEPNALSVGCNGRIYAYNLAAKVY